MAAAFGMAGGKDATDRNTVKPLTRAGLIAKPDAW
jgi:hypothetical protein